MLNTFMMDYASSLSDGQGIECRRAPEHDRLLISSAQVRAAHALLRWSMMDLAKAAQVSVSTVKRFEDGRSSPVSDSTIAMMQDALEAEGVHFLPDDEQGSGLRFRPR